MSRTVPLDSLRNGNVGYYSPSNSGDIVKYATPAQIQALDPQGVGEALTGSSFNKRFPHSNAAGGDGVNSGGYTFNAPNNDYETNYVGRIDYSISNTMKVFARFTIARENAVNAPNEFAGDPVTDPVIDRSYAFVLGHTWVIGSNKVNRAILGETVQKLSFPNNFNPDGTTFFTFSDGIGTALASSEYLNPNAQARRIPIEVVRDDFSWTKGRHNWQMGGSFKNILAHSTDVIDYNEAYVGLGGLTTSLCGPVNSGNAACGTSPGGTPYSSLRPSDIDPAATGQL